MFVKNADLMVQIKMAKVVITLRIMPDSPDANLDKVEQQAIKKIKDFVGSTEIKRELEPVAFGINALKIIFVMDENLGSTEELENNISKIDNVNSVEVIDVRRAIG